MVVMPAKATVQQVMPAKATVFMAVHLLQLVTKIQINSCSVVPIILILTGQCIVDGVRAEVDEGIDDKVQGINLTGHKGD